MRNQHEKNEARVDTTGNATDRLTAPANETAARTRRDVIHALRQFLQWGEDAYTRGEQGGYFSGGGWAAVTVRAHVEQLQAEEATDVHHGPRRSA